MIEPLEEASLATRPLLVSASAVGSSHARDGIGCQDRAAWVASDDGGVTIAVADGLGSAARADLGAAVAVAAACDARRGGPEAMIAAARAALEEAAEREGCALRDLATTLMAVTASQASATVAHIGDGAVAIRSAGAWRVLSSPAPAEYVNEVTPLTAPGWRSHVRVAVAPAPIEALAVLTDGLQRAALLPSGEAHAGFFEPLAAHASEGGRDAEVEALLAGPKLGEHSDDDKTIVVAILR